MVNPRWRPELANSRIPDGKHNKEISKLVVYYLKDESRIPNFVLGQKSVRNGQKRLEMLLLKRN